MIPTDELGEQFLSTVSIESRAVVASVVEHRIEREYGVGDEAGLRGATQLAVAAISMDVHRLYVGVNGTDQGVESLAATLLRELVNEGLEQRRCQCVLPLGGHTPTGHAHTGQCSAHYEADVPPIDGDLLCGTCHTAVYQAKNT